MKSTNRISRILAGGVIVAAALAAVPAILRADGTNAVKAADSKPTPYPLTTCLISGDKLGEMGDPVVFLYQTNGINQEIKFCCPMCKPKFLADPGKYMKIIQQAETKSKGDKN